MQHKHTLIAGIILTVLIAGMFIFAYLKSNEIVNRAEVPTQNTSATKSPYDVITRIDAKHFFIDGIHTLVGEVQMPTPCDLLNWETRIAESYPEQVTIDFTIINNTTNCASVVTTQRFHVVFSASEQATMQALLNGRRVELNLIPSAPGETPESFELFLKG